jgi:hypothetical protein
MKIILGPGIGVIIGVILGAACSALITAQIVKVKMQPKYTDNPQGCGKVLPSCAISIDGIPRSPAAATNNHDQIGYGTKLGGEPDWIQGVDIPICPSCKTAMLFVAQIDSRSMIGNSQPRRRFSSSNARTPPFTGNRFSGAVGKIGPARSCPRLCNSRCNRVYR